MLLVHGAISDRSAWILVQPILAKRFTVYTMNRPGRDGSGPPLEHALEREFEDVVAVVEAIGESVHLLGHSGGAISSLGAALLTDRLRSLILYEPPSPGQHDDMNPDSIREFVREGKNEEAAIEFLSEWANTPEDDLERLKQSPIWPHIVALAPPLPSELDALAGYEFDVSRFRSLDVPLLLLIGGDSGPRIREVSEALADVVPNVRTVELAGQQHGANLAAPELFASEVTKFLDQL